MSAKLPDRFIPQASILILSPLIIFFFEIFAQSMWKLHFPRLYSQSGNLIATVTSPEKSRLASQLYAHLYYSLFTISFPFMIALAAYGRNGHVQGKPQT